MAEGQTEAYHRRVVADIKTRVDSRVQDSIEKQRSPLAFFRSSEFKLLSLYLKPKTPTLLLLSFLSILRTAAEALLLMAVLVTIQLMFGSAAEANSFNLFGYDLSIPFQSLSEGQGGLAVIIGGLLIIILIWSGVNFVQQHIAYRLQRDFSVQVREDILDKMLSLDISYFRDTKTGEIAYLQNTIVNRFSSLIPTLQNLISTILDLAVVGVILVQLSASLTALFAVLSLTLYLFMRFMRRRVTKLSFLVEEHSLQSASTFLEIIYGIRLVKLGGQEGRSRERYLTEMREREDRTLILNDNNVLAGMLSKLSGPLILIFAASMVSFLSTLALIENIGFILAYFLIAQRGLSYVTVLLNMRLKLSVMYPHLSFVTEFLFDNAYVDKQIDVTGNSPPLPQIRNGISVENLSFSYNGDETVLNNLSLDFKKGTMTALVGLSGSGKSTLLELLARFLTSASGKIYVDGVDISAYDISSYRQRSGYVTQEMVIFNDTILENLRYLKPEATQAQVERAVQQAMAEQFVSEAENGYQTEIGERGLKMSGGQRQRIALARVLLQNPEILLLDEATSAVDLYTEARIFETLMGLKKDKIIVVATHRLSAITQFDNIVVLHKGQIMEQGNHEELMASQGLYFNLYNLQEYESDTSLQHILPDN